MICVKTWQKLNIMFNYLCLHKLFFLSQIKINVQDQGACQQFQHYPVHPHSQELEADLIGNIHGFLGHTATCQGHVLLALDTNAVDPLPTLEDFLQGVVEIGLQGIGIVPEEVVEEEVQTTTGKLLSVLTDLVFRSLFGISPLLDELF